MLATVLYVLGAFLWLMLKISLKDDNWHRNLLGALIWPVGVFILGAYALTSGSSKRP